MENGNHLFLLLKSSWEASVLIVLVLALQWIGGRRLPPRWRYALWLLVIARLALPWTFPSAVSLYNWVSLPGNAVSMVQPPQRVSISNPQATGTQTAKMPQPNAGAARAHESGNVTAWLNLPTSGFL